MKKGDTVEAFLQAALRDLRKEFHELYGHFETLYPALGVSAP